MTEKVYQAILANGHQLLTQVGKKTKTTIEFKSPFQIEDHKNLETGQGNMLLSQYLFSEVQDAKFSKESIMTLVEVSKPLSDYYWSYKLFNDKFIVANLNADINIVTEGIKKLLNKSEEPQVSQEENNNLIIFKSEIDIHQLYIPTSNTVN